MGCEGCCKAAELLNAEGGWREGRREKLALHEKKGRVQMKIMKMFGHRRDKLVLKWEQVRCKAILV